jgi:ankyrin repeat protein
LLLTNGADKEVKDNQGRTPLKIAEEKGHQEIVELLLSPGVRE